MNLKRQKILRPQAQRPQDEKRQVSDVIKAYHVTITGVVQGVGFRPFVYNLATRLGLTGWVLNHSGGVDLEAEGPEPVLQTFLTALREEAPPLARIESLTSKEIAPNNYQKFEIRHSERQEGRYQIISPDVATCADCLRELFDPNDRRYRYPFINCTNCGPRFTIIKDIPYDRPNTTMRVFPLCEDCREEYEDPTDRRFHAQPNACPVCGPHIWLTDAEGEPMAGDRTEAVDRRTGCPTSAEAVLTKARALLLEGKILAIKGLGGFHLACDATNADAVQRLRARNRRPHKPFAVMVPTLEDVRAYCECPPQAEALLTSPQCPIVLLKRRDAPAPVMSIADAVAPNTDMLGMMIPYTPLHHILLRDVGRPLVMTSGNVTEEPIAKDNDEALRRLGALADAFLLHNRDIYARYDDSVWHLVPVGQMTSSVGRGLRPTPAAPRQPRRPRSETCGEQRQTSNVKRQASDIPQPLRRARGYAPLPVHLPFKLRRIFATGPEMKNTFCLTRDEYAFVSQHIGDMENLETLEHYEAALETYKHLFRIEPEEIVCDLHPDYLTTRLAHEYAQKAGLPAPLQVQHHHAHIASCLADSGQAFDDSSAPVIGVALDGTGYGEDGAIWGAEWLVGGYRGFQRVAHLEYLPLPGGDVSVHRPWRIAVAYLYALLGEEVLERERIAKLVTGIDPTELTLVQQQVKRHVNTPVTSSMGRLFDAVSALLGVCREATYEAQAAIELEQVSRVEPDTTPYPFDLSQVNGLWIVRLTSLFEALLTDLEHRVPVSQIGGRFHVTVADMVYHICQRLREARGLNTVALSGGVFQNRLLLGLTIPWLEAADFEVLIHHQLPSNDGCVSLGQAVLAQFAGDGL